MRIADPPVHLSHALIVSFPFGYRPTPFVSVSRNGRLGSCKTLRASDAPLGEWDSVAKRPLLRDGVSGDDSGDTDRSPARTAGFRLLTSASA